MKDVPCGIEKYEYEYEDAIVDLYMDKGVSRRDAWDKIYETYLMADCPFLQGDYSFIETNGPLSYLLEAEFHKYGYDRHNLPDYDLAIHHKWYAYNVVGHKKEDGIRIEFSPITFDMSIRELYEKVLAAELYQLKLLYDFLLATKRV